MPPTFHPAILADAATTATTRAVDGDATMSVYVVVLSVFAAGASVGVAWLLGFLRPAALGRAERVPPDRPLRPLLGVLLAGLVVWLVAPTLFLRPGPPVPGQPLKPAPTGGTPSLREMVVINATIPLVAFVILVVGDRLVRAIVGQRLGFDLRSFPRGLAGGVVGIVFALPIVYCSMVLAELVYQQIGYRHPSEHDLLRAMGETPDAVVKYLAIVAAVVVAPLWEELLFRGHIQTLIRAAMVRVREAAVRTQASVPTPRPGESLDYLATAPELVAPPRPHAPEALAATMLTALLFAGVHQPWTWPPIFVLSVCLGIAYERTGNLWVPVVMHASFNALMTTYFLLRGMMN